MTEEFNLKLSDINKKLRLEGLVEVSREQARYLMGRQKGRKFKRNQDRVYVDMLIEGEHYIARKCKSYNKYLFSVEGDKLLYRWSIARKQELRKPIIPNFVKHESESEKNN